MSGRDPVRPVSGPTPAVAQSRASDPTVSAWVGASAGTGKTKVLTDRVLRLMLGTADRPGTAPDRLLCITFTKAAASEMGNRLADRLRRWAVEPDDALRDGLAELTGAPPTRTMMDRARKLFARVLDLPGGMRILTVHAFCQSILRRFPVEAGVSPQFRAIEERDQQDLLDRIRREVLAASDPPVSAAIEILTAEMDEAALTERLRALVSRRARFQRVLDAQGGEAGAVRAATAFLGCREDDTDRGVVAAACDDAVVPAAALRRAVAALRAGGKTARDRADRIGGWLETGSADRVAAWEHYAAAFLTNDGTVRASLADKPSRAALADIDEILTPEAARVRAVADRRKAVAVARATAALIALGEAVFARYRAAKARRGLLDFDDLIDRTARLLRSPGRAPWVLFKLDGGIDHILVDEAQDTSPAQWAIIDALAAEFFAGQGARDEVGRTLFVVGDEKQSIYSFQGADPAEFGRQRGRFDGQARRAARGWRQVPLDASFRSGPAVLSFVDAVFADGAARDGVVLAEEAQVRHAVTRRGQAGRITLWPAVPAPETEPVDPWAGSLDEPQSQIDRLAGHLAATIKGWIEAGERLPSRDRPIHAGDVLILVRSRNQLVPATIRALKLAGVPVAGADRMVLTDQIGVQDLLAALRFALLPSDDLTLAALLRSPLIDLAEDRLIPLCHGRRGTVWRALSAAAEEAPDLRPVRHWLTGLIEAAERLAPYDLLASVLGQACPADPHSGRRAMLGRLGPEAEEAIDELLTLALDFQRGHAPSLQAFVQWIEAGDAEVKREQESRAGWAVRIMTVHGAKGLQAPIVILPDARVPARNPSRPERFFWPDTPAPTLIHLPRTGLAPAVLQPVVDQAARREEQEYRRLLYVALTRAEDRLLVAGIDPKRGRRRDTWYDLVAGGLARCGPVVEAGFDGPWPGLQREYRLPQTAPPDRPDRPRARLPGQAVPDWAWRPPPSEPTPTRPLTPSRPSEPEPAVGSPLGTGAQAQRFKRGLLIHALLQALPDLPRDRRADAAVRFLAQPAHGLTADQGQALAAEVLAVLAEPDFTALFGPGSRAEVPIVGTVGRGSGSRSLSGQIDRLVVTDTHVLIVDFKTNRPPPRRIEDVPALYGRQLAAYRAALAAVYPDRTIRCGLLWTDSLVLMWLPDALLDTHAP